MNPSTAQAEVLVDELVRGGVTDAVLCPGSRNAPLSFALHRADTAGRIRLHVRIDERGAAFLALGLALRSGRAVPVVCTSGTAAANLHPAVLEASHAGVPLLALTADRPPELIGTGANQTIVQTGLFGTAPRLELTLGLARRAAGQQATWRSAVARAVGVALGRTGGLPGPVHLNLPFAEPLVPDSPGGAAPGAGLTGVGPAGIGGGAVAGLADWPEPLHGRAGGLPWTELPPAAAAEATPLPLDPDLPTLVVAGAVPTGPVPGAPTGRAPVIAEPGSPLWSRALRTGAWLLGAPVPPGGPSAPRSSVPLRPAQVVLHGRPTLHRSVAQLLADDRVAVYAVAGTVGAELPPSVRAVGSVPTLTPPRDWCARWVEADQLAGDALDKALTEPTAPVGLRLAAAMAAALPAGAVLTLGSSNPVRDVSLAARPRPGLRIVANRGVAGIDGTVSTATGASLAHGADGGGPGYALLGDLTVLHDLSALVLGPNEPRPDLTLVVLNDSGGGIFSLLEQGTPEHAASFERVFGTPHRVRLDAVCAGLGVGYRRVDELGALPGALGGPGDGIRVVEVPAEREGLREAHAALTAAVNAALA
ncbi:MAG TPA: 2-succinyl-5-enolpyruvyl-6-hydroxy-3-cyclohexene-1-carboxylic-acid synthase [Pseudonocardia sp.]|jgi:2-succinyl-5-enolpyruvyl-6-hydroxy-3-cyclohexene-1-carboxylate synthase|nr:2-succinyl-5-enolpyruvyl-6-hydroxy-3-cyclohexene-1-carboxylic-acid synthase [Pseudonocardia sp.]